MACATSTRFRQNAGFSIAVNFSLCVHEKYAGVWRFCTLVSECGSSEEYCQTTLMTQLLAGAAAPPRTLKVVSALLLLEARMCVETVGVTSANGDISGFARHLWFSLYTATVFWVRFGIACACACTGLLIFIVREPRRTPPDLSTRWVHQIAVTEEDACVMNDYPWPGSLMVVGQVLLRLRQVLITSATAIPTNHVCEHNTSSIRHLCQLIHRRGCCRTV